MKKKIRLLTFLAVLSIVFVGCESEDNDEFCHNYLCSDGYYYCEEKDCSKTAYYYEPGRNVYPILLDLNSMDFHYHPCEIHSVPLELR